MDSLLLFGGKILHPVVAHRLALVFLYLGPDTIMPMASILAAALGFILLFWRVIDNFFQKIFRRGKPESSEAAEEALVDPGPALRWNSKERPADRERQTKPDLMRPGVKKVIAIGLDGLEPTIVEAMFAAGDLPNLQRLRRMGGYRASF